MNFQIFMDMINEVLDSVIMPMIVAGCTALFVMIRKYAKKIVSAIEAKIELEMLVKTNEVKSQLLAEIDKMVESAVGSNMQLADQMKSVGIKLTDEQKEELQSKAKTMVMNSLPITLTEKDGVLMKLIGGEERLNNIIDASIEKFVYKYKLAKRK